jgi:DNA-binding phage protein
MADIAKEIQSLISQSNKTRYRIAKDAKIQQSTLQRVLKDGWGEQFETAQKILAAVGKELAVRDIDADGK